jgi:hypothetical protein
MTSTFGASFVFFSRKKNHFYSTEGARKRCFVWTVITAFYVIFFIVRTLQSNENDFPFCYTILLAATLPLVGTTIQLLNPEEFLQMFNQMNNFSLKFKGNFSCIPKDF